MRSPILICAAAAAAVLPAAPALGGEAVFIDFRDGDVQDTFVVENAVECTGVGVNEVAIDLSGAGMRLAFDTAGATGASYSTGDANATGFEITEGETFITGIVGLTDGGTNITVNLKEFGPATRLTMVLDVDNPDAGAAKGSAGDDAAGLILEGTAVAAKMTNASGETHAENGVFSRDNTASIAWDAACSATQ